MIILDYDYLSHLIISLYNLRIIKNPLIEGKIRLL
jgi:hypothetical protein